MRKAPYMPFYPADFEAKTLDLNCEEVGAYLLLIFAMWRAGGKLPADEARLATIARLSKARWRRVAEKVRPYFNVCGECWTHDRVSEEITKLYERSTRGKNGAKGRWKKDPKPKSNNNVSDALAYAVAPHKQCLSEAIHIQNFPKGKFLNGNLTLDEETEAANRAPLRSRFGGAQ
ncbi:DUF1376 domain-containing protein [Asticcacaulis sp.]|uniref:YdaU family protein n=1 Tax=Asticcacaulis sp. TaxID=1872648 RepID=UPI0031D66DDC